MLKNVAVLIAFLGLTGAAFAQGGGGNDLTNPWRDIQVKYVYNQDAVSHSSGAVVCYVGNPTATYPGVSVSTTITPYDGSFAGIVYQNPIGANSWGFIQTQGYNPAVLVASATIVGDLLWPSATPEKASAHSAVVVASESCKAFGMAMTVNASSAAIPAIIFGH